MTEVPYGAAQRLFGDLTGVGVGSERMHTVTNQVAEGLTVLNVTPTRLKQIKEADVIPEDKIRICVVSDGAERIWKHVQALFPTARQVLDYYHYSDYIHNVAKA